MIVGAELKNWLDDRSAQSRTEQAARRFARDWNQGATHRDLDKAMRRLPEDADAEAVVAAARALLDDQTWTDALIGELAAETWSDPYFEPPFRALHGDIHTGLLVYEDRHLTLAAGVSRLARLARRKQIGRGKGSVHFTGRFSLFRFVKSGGATLAFWECDPIGARFSAATAGTCRPADKRRIADGETILVDGRREAFIIEHARSNFVVLQANVKTGQAPVSAEYDAQTHRFIACNAVDESDCRIQMMSTLIRLLGNRDGFAAIAPFLDHPSFFVRWHAMKELLGIDAEAALPHLKLMAARDSHPDARAAARQVLDRIERPARPRKAA